MKKSIIYMFVLFMAAGAFAQDQAQLTKAMLEQADDMGKKFVAKDYAAFLKYTHPATVETMGGKKKMLEKTTTEMQSLESEGIIVTAVDFGVPSKIITVGNELQCTLPELIILRLPKGKLTSTTTMIAISNDKGKSWMFVDSAGNSLQNMKLLIPTLSDELYIPMPQDPSFEPDEKSE